MFYINRELKKSASVAAGKDYNNELEIEKEANLVKLRELVSSTNEKITDDWVQEKLNISDSTATRYLDELETEGIIKQIGTEGRFVYYQKV